MSTIPINRDLVNFYMEWDFDNLLNLRDVLTHLRIITKEEIGTYFFSNRALKQFKTLLDRLEELCKNVFHWDYERFPDPIDQYAYIADNWENISEDLFKGLGFRSPDFKPTDNFETFTMFCGTLKAKIKFMAMDIIETGLKHGFKPANIPNDHFLPGENIELTQ